MKKFHIRRPLTILMAALMLAISLSSCVGNVIYQVTVDDFTYTLRGAADRAEQITVTRDGKRVATYKKRGMPGKESGENYGFRLIDLNFDDKSDMQLLIAREDGGDIYATYLWDEESEKYVYNATLSTLRDMGTIASLEAITAREFAITIDPATDDTPDFEIRRETFVIYLWQNGALTPVHRKELTYYEESDIYCYLIQERNDRGEWDIVRESWIAAERFDSEKCPLDATGFEGYAPN